MLLTITYTGRNTTDLGYLLYKNPYRPQVFELSHGNAYVFYPEATDERTTAALLLDIDPIDLARGKVGSTGGGLFDYVNDRPYVSSSFLSTAISKVSCAHNPKCCARIQESGVRNQNIFYVSIRQFADFLNKAIFVYSISIIQTPDENQVISALF